MLNTHENEVSLSTRKKDTLLGRAAVKGGKLGHYLSRSMFEETILKLGPLAENLNEVFRRTDILELKSMTIFISRAHRSFHESLLSLYSLDSNDGQEVDQKEYLKRQLRGKFFDISELETCIQLVPVSADADIVKEVQRHHPAAAFKIKIGNPR